MGMSEDRKGVHGKEILVEGERAQLGAAMQNQKTTAVRFLKYNYKYKYKYKYIVGLCDI